MPDFEDFLLEGGWEFVFPDDSATKHRRTGKEFECPHCRYIITPEEVDTFDKEFGTIECPSCGKEIEL